jgi:hypothetical protein
MSEVDIEGALCGGERVYFSSIIRGVDIHSHQRLAHRAWPTPPHIFLLERTHVYPLQPSALAFMSYGFVFVRVRVRGVDTVLPSHLNVGKKTDALPTLKLGQASLGLIQNFTCVFCRILFLRCPIPLRLPSQHKDRF